MIRSIGTGHQAVRPPAVATTGNAVQKNRTEVSGGGISRESRTPDRHRGISKSAPPFVESYTSCVKPATHRHLSGRENLLMYGIWDKPAPKISIRV